MKRFVLNLSDEQHSRLKQLAYDEGAPIAELVRRAIDQMYGTQHTEVPPPGRKPSST